MISVLTDFARFMAMGLTSPRATVRTVLNGGHGFDVALLLIALGYVIKSIMIKLIGFVAPDPPGTINFIIILLMT